MDNFNFDVLLNEHDICNLRHDTDILNEAIDRGERLVFVGRRNMGKTSLMRNRVLANLKRKHPSTLVLFADLMGVKSLHSIHLRIHKSFEQALASAKPTATFLQGLIKTLKHVRPSFETDPMTGSTSFSLGIDPVRDVLSFEDIFEQVGRYHKTVKSLIVIDEFQDVAEVDEAEALFRNALQQLPSNLPVIIIGSKKHMLAKIFAEPNAPLANWGRQHEISQISPEDFLPYINQRLKSAGASVSLDLTNVLLRMMDHVPEAVNVIGHWWQRNRYGAGELSERDILLAIEGVVEERSPLYREYMSYFTEKEETVLFDIARHQPVNAAHSNEFLSRVKMSPGGISPLIRRLENRAI